MFFNQDYLSREFGGKKLPRRWCNKKVLKDNSSLIDGLLETLYEDGTLFGWRLFLKEEMKIWMKSYEQSMEKEEGTFGKVMLGSWMESNFWWYEKEDAVMKPSDQQWMNWSRQVPLEKLCFVDENQFQDKYSRQESYKMDSDHLLKTNLKESRRNQIIQRRQVKCYSVTISGKFGVDQLFTQDFTHTRWNTDNNAIKEVENQIKLPLELTRNQDKLLLKKKTEGLLKLLKTSNRSNKWTC